VGREIVYCNQCGIRILSEEFEKGRAVARGGKNYCRKCMKRFLAQDDKSSGRHETVLEEDPEAKPDPPPSTRRAPARSSESGSPSPGTTRVYRSGKSPWLPRDPTTRVSLAIGIVILLAALVLLFFVLNRNDPSR
jgi:hypothetical protein